MIDIDKINDGASKHLVTLLEQFSTGELSEEDVIAITYGSMITASALGYVLTDMAMEAEAAADRWLAFLEQEIAPKDSVDDV